MDLIDLRSDTVTQPTPEMRAAMATAQVGDDVAGEDPAINALEERAAELLGMEAAVIVPSGTMGNLLALLVHARAGEEVIADAASHIFLFEGAGPSSVGGIQLRPVTTEHGVMSRAQIIDALRPRNDVHQPRTALLCVENTHNRHSGAVWPLEEFADACATAHEHGVPVHVDGARLFNAAIAAGVEARVLAGHADSVMFCLSKGLSAPVGSVLCGPSGFIEEARRKRKMLGGGMRQAGVLAACGSWALEHMMDQLRRDHDHAHVLADELAGIEGLGCDPSRIESNILIVSTPDRDGFVRGCRERGVLVSPSAGERVRMVTHYGIEMADVERAIPVFADVTRSLLSRNLSVASMP
jgi:threonine aldolase